jgi:curved DNA-binding protein CbpA
MCPNDSLPDYYLILQVRPVAEPEVIDAAYKSLMRKYHPDAIPPDMRGNPDLNELFGFRFMNQKRF